MSNKIYYYQLHPFFNKDAKMWFDKIPQDIVKYYPELRDIAAGKSPMWVAMVWLMKRSPEDKDRPHKFFDDIRRELKKFYSRSNPLSFQFDGGGYAMDIRDNVGGQWEQCDITWDGMYLKRKWDKSSVQDRLDDSGELWGGIPPSTLNNGYIHIRHLLWPIKMKRGNQLFINWPLRPPII